MYVKTFWIKGFEDEQLCLSNFTAKLDDLCIRKLNSSIVRYFFFSSRRRHTRFDCDWSSDVCSSDLGGGRCVWEYGSMGVWECGSWGRRSRQEWNSLLGSLAATCPSIRIRTDLRGH